MGLGLLDWVEFMVRWFHVIAGIAWIGSSLFYCFRFKQGNHLHCQIMLMEQPASAEVAFTIWLNI